jgi:hypothetical protein
MRDTAHCSTADNRVLRTWTDIQPTLMWGCVLREGSATPRIAAVLGEGGFHDAPRSGVGTLERVVVRSEYEVRGVPAYSSAP